ncbi:ABC transporter substrate-binding protein [Thermodesulfobacteriota bacterium]
MIDRSRAVQEIGAVAGFCNGMFRAGVAFKAMRVFGSTVTGGRARKPALCTAVAWLILGTAVPCFGARMLVDQLGRQVSAPEDPRSVVSFAPSITEIVFSLGQQWRLKGVTQFSDFPPQARDLPSVGSYVRLDLERIVALNPDLCLAVKDGNPIDVVRRLEELGIPVYAVDPRDIGSVMDTVLDIGRVLGASDRAEGVAGEMRRRLEDIRGRVAQVTRRPRVFFQIGISPIVSVGRNSFIHELIMLAGALNVAEGPVPYPRFSREQVLALEPDIIIITTMAREGLHDQEKKEWARWPSLPAARNQRIFLVDSDCFDRPGPRLLDGLEVLTRLIHPQLFGVQP